MKRNSILSLIFFATKICHSSAEDLWSFIVLGDPHIAETFAAKPKHHPWHRESYARHLASVKHLKVTYGGDLVLIPGDTNSGKWYRPEFAEKLGDKSLTPKQAILRASHGCYGTLRRVFNEGGYQKLMVAIGDHELGGNGWNASGAKYKALQVYRDGFQKELNRDERGVFMFVDPIGKALSRPFGTQYENTSYAQRHKNALFITIDCFHDKGFYFLDRKNGLGGEGSVTVSVEGEHLQWFENVLHEAQNDDDIKHIIVQAHVPVLHPVRKINSSGQFFDNGSDSAFWKIMVKYGVDIYFAGEEHATTASKDENSNLVQVVSRGNQFNNFFSVEVSDDSISIKAFNEVGEKPTANNNYVQFGEIMIDKSGDKTAVGSSGILELIGVQKPLMHFGFESSVPMQMQPVVGMKNKKELILSEIEMRGVMCSDSMENTGSLGQQYNAQIANIKLARGRRGELAGKFHEDSRFGIYAGGPHGPPMAISYNIWIKTSQKNSEMVLVHYGHVWGDMVNDISNKDTHMLTLHNGNPILYIGPDAKLAPSDPQGLNDGKWHHISASMPEKSCRLSDIVMFVDGKLIETHTPLANKRIFHLTGGRMSIGGLGYSSNYEDIYPTVKPYIGLIDDFYLFGRAVGPKDLKWMAAPRYDINYGKSCVSKDGIVKTFKAGAKKCSKRCSQRSCKGWQLSKTENGDKRCTLYEKNPEIGESKSRTRCALLLE